MSNQNTVGRSSVSFLAGALVGAVTALFLAPVSGRELRAKVREEAQVDWDKATTELNRILTDTRRAMDTLRDTTMTQLDQLRAKDEAEEPVAGPDTTI